VPVRKIPARQNGAVFHGFAELDGFLSAALLSSTDGGQPLPVN